MIPGLPSFHPHEWFVVGVFAFLIGVALWDGLSGWLRGRR